MLVNAYSTLADPPEPRFAATINARRDAIVDDEWEPELAEHLEGFRAYVWHVVDEQMSSQVYAVLEHLRHVRTHLSMEVPEDRLDDLAAWGWAANALLFLESGSVVDPTGREVLPDPETGEPAPGEVPVTDEARERAGRVRAELAGRGIQVADSLPPVRSTDEVVPQRPADVALRALGLGMVADFAAGCASGEPLDQSLMEQSFPRAFAALSFGEQELFADHNPEQAVQLSWRWEAAAALFWALGRWEQGWPSGPVDTGRLSDALFGTGEEQATAEARLRPVGELLDEQERARDLLWAVREAQHFGGAEVADVHPSVVIERLEALNWLLDGRSDDWDETDTPT